MKYLHTNFAALGLNESDVDVFLLLIEHHELSVPDLVMLSGYSRTTIYDSLNNLVGVHLVKSRKEKREVFYRSVHPDKIRDMIEAKRSENDLILSNLENNLLEITQIYDANVGKPGVQILSTPRKIHNTLKRLIENSKLPLRAVLNFTTIQCFDSMLVQLYSSPGVERHILLADAIKKPSRNVQLILESSQNEIRYDSSFTDDNASVLLFDQAIIYLKATPRNLLTGCVILDTKIANLQHDLFIKIWLQTPKFVSN